MDNPRQQSQKSPSWDEIFQNIGTQLRKRKKTLALRTLLISGPGLIFIGIYEFLYNIGFIQGLIDKTWMIEAVIYFTLFTVIIAITTIIFNSIFKIEQNIWLDSYFDGKNLTQKESWRIARRLFWASFYFQVKLFCRYYIWVFLTFFAAIFIWMAVFIYSGIAVGSWVLAISWCFIIVIIIGLVIWFRYLKLRLSYAPFLFLDRYKKENIHSPVFWSIFFKELKKLHELSKGETFIKNVLFEVGVEVGMNLNQHITARIKMGFEMGASLIPSAVASAAVSSIGTVVAGGVKETLNRILFFARLCGRYVLYQFAFKSLNNKKTEINEYIYNLKKKKESNNH